jgi:hypothetical protein
MFLRLLTFQTHRNYIETHQNQLVWCLFTILTQSHIHTHTHTHTHTHIILIQASITG